jgi:phage-related protein
MGGWVVALIAVGVAIVANIIQNWDKAKEVLGKVGVWILNNITLPIQKYFSNLWTNIINSATKTIDKFKAVFTGIKTFIKSIIDNILGNFKSFGIKAGEAVMGAFKSVINSVLKTVENVLNTPIRSINSLLNEINDVPGINLKKLNTIKLPRLEVGGVVNLPGRGVPVGGAIGGERGAEGVIPLTNTQMMKQLGATIGRYITVNNHITTTLNGRVIGRELKRSENESNFAFNK